MGGTYFPLDDIIQASALTHAVVVITNIADEYEEILREEGSNGQWDNTTIDGGYIYRLRLASKLLMECIKGKGE
jgi:hypothetical protein